jgi:hypothetical protein
MLRNIPSFKDLGKYKVNRPGESEVIRQSLFDFQPYLAAGQSSLTFFQVPNGQSSKTIADTNMEMAGTLPNPKYFLVEGIEIFFYPGNLPFISSGNVLSILSNINDVNAVAKSGSLNFFIGSKTYLEEAPIGRFPPSAKLDIATAISDQVVVAQATTTAESRVDYATMTGRPYALHPPVLLEPNQNFKVTLSWPSLIALPSGVAGRIGVVLNGIMYRLSQ